jgi:hypothetical protein
MKYALWVPDKWARTGWALMGVRLPAQVRCELVFVPPRGVRPRNVLLRGPHGVLFTTTWRSVRWVR